MDNYTTYKESQNIIPVLIDNKEDYYHDLMNIEHSWTGRLDAMIGNSFFQEAVQLIINAITIFEKGYFDCAFYSLRQSLEVSTTIIYLIDADEETKSIELAKWKSQSDFPMYGQMLKMLESRKSTFADIKIKMADYFSEVELVKRKLNKRVHKQGFKNFYVARSRSTNREKDQEALILDFKKYLEKCIGAVAVFRLAIDPFPVLLLDEDIYKRTGQFITESYAVDFVKKYIGEAHLETYKTTDIYLDTYAAFINSEEMLPSVLSLVKEDYIDKENVDEILSQKHLISPHDLAATIIISNNESVAKVYKYGGILYYFSSTKSARESYSFDSRDFRNIKESTQHSNVPYDEAYLTLVSVANEEYFIEHNMPFGKDELSELILKAEESVRLQMNEILDRYSDLTNK